MPHVPPVPEGNHSVQPYLILADCAAAIDFYRKAFDATEVLRMMNPDGRIGHAEIRIGDSVVMMADEHPQIEAWSPKHYGGSPVSLMFYTADCDAVYRQALAAGAAGEREPADQPYGIRMAGIQDPFGYKWHIGTQIKILTADELRDTAQEQKHTV